jgi:hypothetical protein
MLGLIPLSLSFSVAKIEITVPISEGRWDN